MPNRYLDWFRHSSALPEGLPEGAPFEHFGPLQSETAVDYARQIVQFARSSLA